MIKADDLRRGNLVNSITHNRLFVAVDSILPSGIVLLQGISTYDHIEKIEPIKLDQELLKLFGFTREAYSRTCYIQIGNSLYLEIDMDDFETCLVPETWRGNGGCTTWKKITFFHDLQNVYYDLTGRHLKMV